MKVFAAWDSDNDALIAYANHAPGSTVDEMITLLKNTGVNDDVFGQSHFHSKTCTSTRGFFHCYEKVCF